MNVCAESGPQQRFSNQYPTANVNNIRASERAAILDSSSVFLPQNGDAVTISRWRWQHWLVKFEVMLSAHLNLSYIKLFVFLAR